MHAMAEYLQLSSEEEQELFFADQDVPFQNTIEAHFGKKSAVLRILVDALVVDVIIGELLFENEDEELTLSRSCQMAVFKPVEDGSAG
eukprot:IDg22821t1